jgi:hypothetical protein
VLDGGLGRRFAFSAGRRAAGAPIDSLVMRSSRVGARV